MYYIYKAQGAAAPVTLRSNEALLDRNATALGPGYRALVGAAFALRSGHGLNKLLSACGEAGMRNFRRSFCCARARRAPPSSCLIIVDATFRRYLGVSAGAGTERPSYITSMS